MNALVLVKTRFAVPPPPPPTHTPSQARWYFVGPSHGPLAQVVEWDQQISPRAPRSSPCTFLLSLYTDSQTSKNVALFPLEKCHTPSCPSA